MLFPYGKSILLHVFFSDVYFVAVINNNRNIVTVITVHLHYTRQSNTTGILELTHHMCYDDAL